MAIVDCQGLQGFSQAEGFGLGRQIFVNLLFSFPLAMLVLLV